jgi:thiosulfate dehydrogenase [quinone] large subunit
MPLRFFLAVTFLYAGLSKLLDPAYLDPASPSGVQSQMTHAAAGSPIGGLVTLTAAHATTTGLLIAFGEVAVGLGALLGLWTRLAALGGMLLSLSFFLTVSWGVTPYFTGADIGYLFAWTPLLIAGDGGVLSVVTGLRRGLRAGMGLPETAPAQEPAEVTADVERRLVVRTGAVAAVLGAVTLLTGGMTALVRRPARASASPSTRPVAAQAPVAPSGSRSAAPGVRVAGVADVAVGSVLPFTAPNGDPAYLLHPSATAYLAYSAVCTHQGCTVQHVDGGFACPCHGARFDSSGQVLRGPAQAPLQKFTVVVDGADIRVA